jgi:hypothetical protein
LESSSAKTACEKVDNKYNPTKKKLDFDKLDVSEEAFAKLSRLYNDQYDSFKDYLEEIIDPENNFQTRFLIEELIGDNYDTYRKIDSFDDIHITYN